MKDAESPHAVSVVDELDEPLPSNAVNRIIHHFLVLLERLFLITVAMLTVVVAVIDLYAMYNRGTVELGDLLLLFLYAEVVAMAAVFFSKGGSLFTFPIFIAITALARLVVLEGKDFDGERIMFKAVAVLLLAISVAVLKYSRST